MKYYCGNKSLLLDVPCKKLIIKAGNTEIILGCHNLKVESDNEIIKVTFLVKMMPIGIINYKETEYINLNITENELIMEH